MHVLKSLRAQLIALHSMNGLLVKISNTGLKISLIWCPEIPQVKKLHSQLQTSAVA